MFAMEELTEKWFKNAGIYLFVAAGVQVVAAVTASVLLSDGRKRMAYVRDF